MELHDTLCFLTRYVADSVATDTYMHKTTTVTLMHIMCQGLKKSHFRDIYDFICDIFNTVDLGC